MDGLTKEAEQVVTVIILQVVTHLSKRVTIMIDQDLDKKLRMKQAKMIQTEQSS